MLCRVSSIWYVDTPDPAAVLRAHPDPDPAAAWALARQLHPGLDIAPTTRGTLDHHAGPDIDEVFLGCYPGLTLLCSAQAIRARPTGLPELLVRPLASEHMYMVAFDTARGWGAFAHWERGELRRAFSSTRWNILENKGLPLVWERPYWAGEHPVRPRPGEITDPLTLPYDPILFADAAHREWLGFGYRTTSREESRKELSPADIPVCGFALRSEDTVLDHNGPDDHPTPGGGRRGLLSWLRGHDTVPATGGDE